jgi:2-hydroxychromene-2-carboxylate isomerase
MRIEKLAKPAGLDVRWRPFNLREILIEQNNTPFAKNQIRLNYNCLCTRRRLIRGDERRGVPCTPAPGLVLDRRLDRFRGLPEQDSALLGRADAAGIRIDLR